MPSKSENICSIIDLGTNTCLFLIANLNQNNLTKLFEAQETPRLGKDIYKTGNISFSSFETVSKIFQKYISISKDYKAKKILAFGTSALREAKNRFEFLEFIEKDTGIRIKVISGEEEAKYSFEGATFDIENPIDHVVLDIGGGSTEISFIDNKRLNSKSFDIGSVRLFEKFFKENFSEQNILNAQNYVEDNLYKVLYSNIGNRKLVGVAGTVTTLSAIKNNLTKFDEVLIHKDELTLEEVKNILQKLVNMTNEERLNLGEFMKGRSDIIICGALILIEFMNHFNFNSLTVSTKGLRYGLMLNIADFFY